jgi:hypothetical protein
MPIFDYAVVAHSSNLSGSVAKATRQGQSAESLLPTGIQYYQNVNDFLHMDHVIKDLVEKIFEVLGARFTVSFCRMQTS